MRPMAGPRRKGTLPDLLLIRHAQSAGQAPDAGLTSEGVAQADRLLDELQGHGHRAIFASPYARAVQTIAPFAQAHGTQITKLDGLAERVLAPAPRPDWLDHVARSFTDPEHALPGGESLRQTADRGWRAICDAAASGPAIAVSHGNLIAAVLNRIDAHFGFEGWRALGNPHVIEVDFENGVPVRFRL